jgi:sugar lactone lactonase YvrE
MKSSVCALGSLTAIAALALLSGCSAIAVSPNVVSASGARPAKAATQSIYAFAPDKPLLAVYANRAAVTQPISLLEGPKTQLMSGNGMAVDSDGKIYFVVYQSGSSHSPLKLLVFAPNAHGDAAPERTAILEGPLLAGYSVGLALDGRGNFWITAIGKLLRYPVSARGSAKPNASIVLQLQTPKGLMAANSSNVAVDSAGNVYCSCTVVFQGAQAIGVSEYSLRPRQKVKLVRSFYDFNLPEVPPGSIAVDGAGTIYLASSLPNTGVFAYAAGTKSGNVTYTRRFVTGSGTMISSLTTDAAGKVYVAAASQIMVFGSHANGQVRPIRSIDDPAHLHYTTSTYGTLLNVR